MSESAVDSQVARENGMLLNTVMGWMALAFLFVIGYYLLPPDISPALKSIRNISLMVTYTIVTIQTSLTGVMLQSGCNPRAGLGAFLMIAPFLVPLLAFMAIAMCQAGWLVTTNQAVATSTWRLRVIQITSVTTFTLAVITAFAHATGRTTLGANLLLASVMFYIAHVNIRLFTGARWGVSKPLSQKIPRRVMVGVLSTATVSMGISGYWYVQGNMTGMSSFFFTLPWCFIALIELDETMSLGFEISCAEKTLPAGNSKD